MVPWSDWAPHAPGVAAALVLVWAAYAMRRGGPDTLSGVALAAVLAARGLDLLLAPLQEALPSVAYVRIEAVVDVALAAAGLVLLHDRWSARAGDGASRSSVFLPLAAAGLLVALLVIAPSLYAAGGPLRAVAGMKTVVLAALALLFLHGFTQSFGGRDRHAGLTLGLAFAFGAVHWAAVDLLVGRAMDAALPHLGPAAESYGRTWALVPVVVLFLVLGVNMRRHEVDHVEEGCRGAFGVLLVPVLGVVAVADLLAFGVVSPSAAGIALGLVFDALWAALLGVMVLLLLRHARASVAAVLTARRAGAGRS